MQVAAGRALHYDEQLRRKGRRVMNLFINLLYPIVIQRNIIVITVIRTITVITVECIARHWLGHH